MMTRIDNLARSAAERPKQILVENARLVQTQADLHSQISDDRHGRIGRKTNFHAEASIAMPPAIMRQNIVTRDHRIVHPRSGIFRRRQFHLPMAVIHT